MALVHVQSRGRQRAVVGGVGLPGHRVHARAVVVRSGHRRCRQLDRCPVASRRDKRINLVRARRRVGCRDRRVCRAFVPHRCRRGPPSALVVHRREAAALAWGSRSTMSAACPASSAATAKLSTRDVLPTPPFCETTAIVSMSTCCHAIMQPPTLVRLSVFQSRDLDRIASLPR